MQFLIGCDPELFVQNPNSKQFLSGHDMIPGTKLKPHKVEFGAVQVDGTALEFNTDPASTAEQFVFNVNTVMNQLQLMVPGYQLIAEPAVIFDGPYFETIPSEAKELGCDPDLNAYTHKINEPPKSDQPMRTGSGHIHIGWTKGEDIRDPHHRLLGFEMVKQLDFFLGVPSLIWDSDNRRRSLYGKAGACRIKPYGVEYRVLSNAWLRSDLLKRWVFEAAQAAAKRLEDGDALCDTHGELARRIIDDNDVDGARSAWGDFNAGLPLPPMVRQAA